MENNELILSVSDFVAVFNQTIEYAYPSVTIVGELTNFRISKNKWVYFDLKDDYSSLKFFGTVYQLPGPLEDGFSADRARQSSTDRMAIEVQARVWERNKALQHVWMECAKS